MSILGAGIAEAAKAVGEKAFEKGKELVAGKIEDATKEKLAKGKGTYDLKKMLEEQMDIEQKSLDKDSADACFDFDTLSKSIIRELVNDNSIGLLLDIDAEKRANETNRIYAQCIQDAAATTEDAKRRIKEIIDRCIQKINETSSDSNKTARDSTDVIKQIVSEEAGKSRTEMRKGTARIRDDVEKVQQKTEDLLEKAKSIDEKLDIVIGLPTSPNRPPEPQPSNLASDNQEYLNHFTETLFLEEDDDSKVTLASMYVSPHLKYKDESVAEFVMQWFNSATRKTCMLLYGNAGVGKSSLVSKIIADAYNITQDEDKEFQLSSDQVLAVALRNHFDKIDMSKDAEEILVELFSGYTKVQLKSKLLILDGLDEVCVLRKDFDGHEFLEMLLELDQGFHVLVTSRDAKDYFSNPLDIQNLQIKKLEWTDNEVGTWCSKYCHAKEGKRTWCNQFIDDYGAIPDYDENDHRKEAFCVPIILYICGNSEIKLSEHKSIGSIYGDAFCKILSRTHLKGKKKTKLTRADKPANLVAWQYTKEIAYQMFLLDTLDLAESNDSPDKHAIGLKNAKERTKTILQEKYGIDVPDNALELKKELALCPFTRAKEKENEKGTGGITFAHKTVYEYFTAVKLYEDYFAKFNKSYFGNPDKSAKAAEDVMKTAIAAFRYRAIPKDIFAYLCEMKEAPFSDPAGEEFDVNGFKDAFVSAMENRVLEAIEVKPRVENYFISHDGFDPVNTQIAQALQALLCFITGHGFRNENGSVACKQIRELLVSSDQIVNLEQWNLQEANLQEVKLRKANLQGTNLQAANLQAANLQEANLQAAKLQGAELQGANLQEANLKGAELQRANLKGANLFKTDLFKANLQAANLQAANLQAANLQAANLQAANLQAANLQEVKLRKANLQRTNLQCAYFFKADLQEVNLQGANLQGANLQGANLQGANLRRANLPWAHLRRANLPWAHLQWADLQGANLQGADLQNANLREANLREADLREADLLTANLQRAKLRWAHLQWADLQGANLQGANLQGANLQGANLQRADLQRADLQGADLQGANLRGAKLQEAKLQEAKLQKADLLGANLTGADLISVDLRGANLFGADLTYADLHGAKLTGAKYCKDSDHLTLFPDDFDPVAHGMIEVDKIGIPITTDTTQS